MKITTFVTFLFVLLITLPLDQLFAVNNPYPDSTYLYKQHLPFAGDGDVDMSGINYRLFVPPTYNPTTTVKHPVVIFFHGDGEKENGFTQNNATVQNSKQINANNGQFAFVTTTNQTIFPCFVIYIQTYWLGRDFLGPKVRNLVANLATQYPATGGGSKIDFDRIIVTGLSGGGGAALTMASLNPIYFAAAVTLSPAVTNGANASVLVNVPVWFFHSANDGTVQIGNSTGIINTLRSLGGNPIFTRYANGGHSKACWEAAYDTPALIPWLAAQRRGQAQVNDPVQVTINAPSTIVNYTSSTSSVIVSGTTSIDGSGSAEPGLIKMEWVNGDYSEQWNHQDAVGTLTAWSTASVALAVGSPKSIKGIASGKSWSIANGGVTYYTKTINLSYSPNADLTAPSISIANPTDAAVYTTTFGTLSLSGAAADNIRVSTVTWSNSRGGSGTATGTVNWVVNNITLQAGTNVLTVQAVDTNGNATSTTLTVTYNMVAQNQAPIVSAGSNATITSPSQAALAGTATDDGLPIGGSLSVTWSKVSGPGTVTFANSAAISTNATLSVLGTYVLRLSVTDTALTTTADVTITIIGGFPMWSASNFTAGELTNPLISGELADPDGDGLNNLLEYSFDLPPKTSNNTGQPTTALQTILSNNYLTITFRRRISFSDLTYNVQISGNLTTAWAEGGVQVGSAINNGDGTETVTYRDSMTTNNATKRFIRVLINRSP